MRISDFYALGRTQATLDFVDVDVPNDLKVFVDPRALRLLPSAWGHECVALIQDFFTTVLSEIRGGNDRRARALLLQLKEPNETHLGLSRGPSRGRALGERSSHDVWTALSSSAAVKSGLLTDLEDAILLVDGVADDIISDIATNIIRGPLIQYTQEMADYYGIPLTQNVDSGAMWDPHASRWTNEYVSLPVVRGRRLLLVPKVIVRRSMDYDADEYYSNYILEHLRQFELNSNTELVHLLRDGRRRVTKKDLIAKYGKGKSVNLRHTLSNPELLERYRDDKKDIRPPLSHSLLADLGNTEPPQWGDLLGAVTLLPVGPEHATAYEGAVEKLLSALFHPALCHPTMQQQIHDGRKRIDVTYTNAANRGFFSWLSTHYPAPHIFVECKNYGKEVGNPELDQLTGRFSPSRGVFGILVCRSLLDRELFTRRCIDSARDRRGYVIALDDEDLSRLVEFRSMRGSEGDNATYGFLKQRFDYLIM